MSKIFVEALQHEGFSFVQVLSPCKTFCPEQSEWKHQVKEVFNETTNDPVLAAQRIHSDNGMGKGIVYQSDMPVYRCTYDAIIKREDLLSEFQL